MIFAKKGQEKNKIAVVFSIIIVLVVIALAVLFFTGFFSNSGDKSENLSLDLKKAIATCQAAAQIDSLPQYCRTIRNITTDAGVIYVDCDEKIIEDNFEQGAKQLDCGASRLNDQQIKFFCEASNLNPDTIILGKTCQSVGAV